MAFLRVSSCCCGCNLQTGTKIIAIVSLVLDVANFVYQIGMMLATSRLTLLAMFIQLLGTGFGLVIKFVQMKNIKAHMYDTIVTCLQWPVAPWCQQPQVRLSAALVSHQWLWLGHRGSGHPWPNWIRHLLEQHSCTGRGSLHNRSSHHILRNRTRQVILKCSKRI